MSASSSPSPFLTGMDATYGRMLAFNENMARDNWDWFKEHQRPYEEQVIDAQSALLPQQVALSSADMAAQYELLPYATAYGIEGFEAQRHLLPHQTQLTRSQLEAQQALLPFQTEYEANRLTSQNETLPYLHALGVERIEAQRHLMPYETQTKREQHDAVGQLRTDAAQGIDIDRRVGQAGADAQAIGDAQKRSSQRDLIRMGINPASGRYAGLQRDAEISTAGNKLGAMNQARWTGEEENWQRRVQAAQGFGL